MKAIALHRPWADWVVLGLKTIETRTHDQFKGLVGQTIAIYATKTWDWSAIDMARSVIIGDFDELANLTSQRAGMPLGGGIIGEVAVSTCRWLDSDPLTESMALIECRSVRRFGLFLDQARTVNHRPVRGMQGIFNV